MSGLPRGWTVTELGTVGEVYCGQSSTAADVNGEGRGTPYVTGPEQWNGDSIELNKWTTTPKRTVPEGCIFITVKGAGVGKMFPGIACAIGRDVYAFEPSKQLSYPFVMKALANTVNAVIREARGDIPGLSKEHITDHTVPLPPLAEQKRIVDKLDALNAKSARARTELARIETLVSRYKQAVLSKAFSGELTREWRRLSLGEALRQAQIGLVRSKEQQFANGGTPYVRMNHFDLEGRWHLDDITHVEASAHELQQYALQAGDVLFNTRNSFELVGKVGYWERSEQTFLYNNNILRMRFGDSIASKFAFFQMQSAPFRAYLQSVKSATTSVCAIYQKTLVQAPFVVPTSLTEQHEIVRRIESAFAKIDRLAAEAKRALTLFGKLDEAILAKAFRGELVPQDENDEPAEKLLERIRAERMGAPKARRGRRA